MIAVSCRSWMATRADGFMGVIPHAPRPSDEQLRLGDELVRRRTLRRASCRSGPCSFSSVELETQLVAGQHRAAELRLVDADEVHELPLRIVDRVEEQHAAGLRHRLDDEHRRHDRMAREVALEERLVDGDVLDADDALALLELEDAVHEQERIAVRHDLHDRRVMSHSPAVWPALRRRQLLRRLFRELLHERTLAAWPDADRRCTWPRSGRAEEREVPDEVEDLVAHELVREAQRLVSVMIPCR